MTVGWRETSTNIDSQSNPLSATIRESQSLLQTIEILLCLVEVLADKIDLQLMTLKGFEYRYIMISRALVALLLFVFKTI